MSLVTLEQIKTCQRQLAIELDVRGTFDPEARLQHLCNLLERHRHRMVPEGQLLQYLLHHQVLHHHERFGGVAKAKLEVHLETAQLMLRLLDVKPDGPFGFLYTELHTTMAKIAANEDEYWRSCVATLMAMEATRQQPYVDAPGYHHLIEARGIYRLGHCHLALAGFEAALATGLKSTEREECVIERIRCLRLTGQRDEAKRAIKLAHKESLSAGIQQEILWEHLIHDSLDRGDFTMMLKRTGAWQSFGLPAHRLEAALWVYAVANQPRSDVANTIASLQKKGHSCKEVGPLWQAISLLERLHSRETPFAIKADALAEFMQTTLKTIPVEHAILVVAAIVRFLETAKRPLLHATFMAEYGSLSERYSGGKLSDVLGVFSERRQTTSPGLATAS